MQKNNFLVTLLIVIVGLASYANSLNHQFVYDDEFLIQKNELLQSPALRSELLTKNIRYGAGKETNVYRPLQMFSYKLDYYFWKLNPRGFHLTNIILHILTALAMFFLLNLLFGNERLALFSTLFFVVHPIHTEAVTYISGRADPLAALFFILAFYFYVKYRKFTKGGDYILSVFVYTLALFARENSLIFLLVVMMYDYLFNRKIRAKIKEYLPFIIVSLFYLFLRIKILAIPTAVPQYVPTTLLQRIPGIFSAVCDYFRLLLAPWGLHMEYVMHLSPLWSAKTILGMLIVFFSLCLALRVRQKNALVSFAVFWFWLNFVPVSNVFALNAFMAEHWLYLPSLGFFLLVGTGIDLLFKKNKLWTIIFLSAAISFYSALTIEQNQFWKDPQTLYERILKFSPESSRIHNSLGAVYFQQGRYDSAEQEFKQAIKIKPSYADAYNNLGSIYAQKKLYSAAKEAYQKASELQPDCAQFYINLGNSYLMLGEKERARLVFQEAARLSRQERNEEQARRIEEFLKRFP